MKKLLVCIAGNPVNVAGVTVRQTPAESGFLTSFETHTGKTYQVTAR